jgi:SAM-dependent methyltransferase
MSGGTYMQYAKEFTDALQFMWGEGFLSPGGPEEVAEMVAGIDLTGKRVLDVGSGLGGVDILLATRHGAAAVVGIDVEPQLVESARALIATKGLTERVTFQLVEPGPLPFPNASFDVVFSKDAMVHIEDNAALYAEVLRVLKPGGWFTAADWLWAEGADKSPVDGAAQVHAACCRVAGYDQGRICRRQRYRPSLAPATIQ